MAETAEAKVVVSLVDELSAKLKTIENKFGNFKDVVGESAKKVGAAMTVTGGIITGLAVKSVHDFSEMGDAIEKMATRTGLGAEAVSALRVAADASGTAIETVEASIKKMQLGMPELTANMDAFGISLSDNFVTLDPAAQFEELAQKIGAIQDPAAQTQASIAAFGKAGSDLIPMFEDGSFSMDEWKKKAGEMGVLMSGETASAAADLNDAMGYLTTTVNGLWLQVGTYLAPTFTDLANKLQPVINRVTDWMKENPKLTQMIILITVAVGGLLLILGPLIAAIALIPSIIAGATIAIAFFGSTAGIVTVIIGAVVAAIGLLIIIGKNLVPVFEFVGSKIELFAHNIAGFINSAVSSIRSAWEGFWSGAASVVSGAFEGIKSGIEGGINWVIDKLNGLLDKVNRASATISRLPGIEIPQIGDIPALAKGGIVTKPTLALIGEAGPEAVVPLSRAGAGAAGSFGGMSKTTTINVYANGDNNADLISRLNLMAKML